MIISNTITVTEKDKYYREIRQFCEKNLILPNPDYIKKQRMGFWLGNTPKNIQHYTVDGFSLILPFGIIDTLKENGWIDKWETDIPDYPDMGWDYDIGLYDYQAECSNAMVKAKHGIFIAPTGSGKSNMFIDIILKNNKKALILTHTQDLMNQAKSRIESLADIEVGTITDGKVNIKDITVATVQTMCKLDLPTYATTWGTVVVDECLSGDTEILTEKGFVRFDELSKNLKVAQYSENGEINFVYPTRYIEKEVEEYVSFKNSFGVEIKTSLNHDMVYIDKDCMKLKKKKAYELIDLRAQDKMFVLSGKATDDLSEHITPLQKIGIMLQADGTIYYKYKNNGKITWRLDFSKEEKINEFIRLCKEANIPYKEGKQRTFKNKNWKPSRNFKITLDGCDYKKLSNFLPIPRSYIFAQEILNEIAKWDAYATKYRTLEYDTTIKENADFVKAVAVLAGVNSKQILEIKRKNPKHKTYYRLNLNTVQNMTYGSFERKIVKENLKTYCVEVPSHMFICKKDGLAFVTGNCQRMSGSPTKQAMFYKVLNNLKCWHKYGCTATFHRGDRQEKVINYLLGEIKYEVPRSAVADKIMKVAIQKADLDTPESDEYCGTDGMIEYAKLINYLCENNYRNKEIAQMLNQNYEHSNLILSDRVAHLKELMAMVDRQDLCCIVDGSMTSKKGKEARKQALEDMRNGNKKYLFATFSLAKEGLDIPVLDRLYLTTPHKDKAVIIQSVGRIARTSKGKEQPICYDFVDANIDFCSNAYKKRKTSYRKIDCTINE